jgi:hypothetical protein
LTHISGDLANALGAVGAAMRAATQPWWIIGSAAVILHGATTNVADIDLLAGERDATTLATHLGLRPEQPDRHLKFRSRVFLRWPRVDYDVDIMAGLSVADATGWSTVTPTTRQSITIAGERLFVPVRAELMAILTRFGRPKDLERRQLLAALG